MTLSPRLIVPLSILLTGAPLGLVGQASDVPGPIRQRLGQALWPEVLFDTTGHPLTGYMVRGYRGDPQSGLAVEAVPKDSSPPGLRVYRGRAFRCFDCDYSLAAVVQKGEHFVTLVDPEDLALVLPWVLPASTADSGTVARAALRLLQSTCLLGCGAARLDRKEQLSSFHTALCRGSGGSKGWDLPESSQHTNGSYLAYEFNLWAGSQIYRVTLSWINDQYLVSTDLLADCALRP